MRNIIPGLILILLTALGAVGVSAQQCGPGCPVCSGGVAGNLLAPKAIMGSVLSVPNGEDKTTVFSVFGGVLPWLNAGLGYSTHEEEIIWSVRVLALAEGDAPWRPAVVLGTGSVQTGGSDQSAYIQFVKSLELREGLALTLSGGYATDVPDFREDYGLANVSLTLLERIAPFYTYDGRTSHAGVTVYPTEWLQITGYALELKEPALAMGFRWNFGPAVDEDEHSPSER